MANCWLELFWGLKETVVGESEPKVGQFCAPNLWGRNKQKKKKKENNKTAEGQLDYLASLMVECESRGLA